MALIDVVEVIAQMAAAGVFTTCAVAGNHSRAAGRRLVDYPVTRARQLDAGDSAGFDAFIDRARAVLGELGADHQHLVGADVVFNARRIGLCRDGRGRRSAVAELGSRGIAVSVVAPGSTATDFSDGAVRDDPEVNWWIAQTTAIGRAGVPQGLGPVVAGMLAADFWFANGQCIEVSGGRVLQGRGETWCKGTGLRQIFG